MCYYALLKRQRDVRKGALMAKLQDYDKILTRLTIILQRLYEGEVLGVKELAEEFNVSTKTIQRDFNERLIRFPIEKIGHKWKMQDGHNITKERSAEEVLVIEMLENIAESIGAGFGAKARHLFSKLQNPIHSPIYSKTIIEDISDKLELFQKVEQALEHNNTVTFEYTGKKRHIRPYKIVSFEGYWYLYGEELPEEKLKTFYFKDIVHLKVTKEHFTPKSQNYKVLERAINAWFEPNNESFEVTLHASASIAKYFQRRPLAITQKIVKLYKDGSMDISVLATSNNEVLHEVKRWMPDLVVIDPQQLAKEAKDIAQKFITQQEKQT